MIENTSYNEKLHSKRNSSLQREREIKEKNEIEEAGRGEESSKKDTRGRAGL